MSRYSINPARLLDRPWRSGHPFRPHRGRCRRIVLALLILLLSLIIGGYTYLTDAARVRRIAEGYLSELLGGRVEIGRANLSIFEGLRVDDVKVYVDRDPRKRPDALVFSAKAFVLNYDPRKMIAGQLESSEIIAQKPQVYLTLTHGADQDSWNYQRLFKGTRPAAGQAPAERRGRIVLPQVLLRNAFVRIGEVRHGRLWPVGSMAIDGQLTPAGDGKNYRFEVQTRGREIGPYATGMIDAEGRVEAHLHNLQFDNDVRSMLPASLAAWWERHEIGGQIETVDVRYAPPLTERARPRFDIQVKLDGVTLSVHREEWSSREEITRIQRLQNALALLRDPYRLAGFNVGGNLGLQGRDDDAPGEARPGSTAVAVSAAAASRVAYVQASSPVDLLERTADTSPLVLRGVTGTFEFDQDGVRVPDDAERPGLLVSVGAGDANDPQASNAFKVIGHIDGYDPGAPLHLEVSTADPDGLYFPSRPRFMDSLPVDVRNFYEELKPQGHCRIHASVNRPTPGAAPRVNGEVEVVDATFNCRQFPYAFRQASGKIAFGRDPFTGLDYVSVINMHAHGIVGGPNENSLVSISGTVGPLGADHPEPGFELHATGQNIASEPALMAAMPPEVRTALAIFDATGHGQYPQFRGNFSCDVHRPPGPRKRFTFDTMVHLSDAAGQIKGFPYLLHHAAGTFRVRDDYVDILDVRIPDHGGEAKVTGRVRWNDDQGRDQPLDMSVQVQARGFPIDRDLLAAIPPEDADWLRRLGVAGTVDVDGKVFTTVAPDWREHLKPHEKPKDPPIQFDLALGVRDGTIWPSDGLFSISGVNGKLHLNNDRLDILELHGRREEAELSGAGTLILSGPDASMRVHGTARNLGMDRPLYALLPADGRKAWDECQPSGRVDAEIEYRRSFVPAASGAVASADAEAAPLRPEADEFRAVLRPRQLAVRVRTAPYPLTFDRGSVTITPGRAVLAGLEGTHGHGRLAVEGSGDLAGIPDWHLQLHARDLSIDDELRKAMPPTLLAIVDGLKLGGQLGFDFKGLHYRGASAPAADPDIDVDGTVLLDRGTMDVGMPLTAIRGGALTFAAAVRQGKLESLNGSMAFDQLSLGGRPLRDLKLALLKQSGHNELHVDHLQARVAGGELAGGVLLTFPDAGANRYSMNLVLRDADVRELTGDKDHDMRGELTASLALEGAWGETTARRGRGDVVIAGKQLYRIPLMLGLLQVTNLSLPIGQPFTRGSARYTVEGSRINFEQMDLRADGMSMGGTGYLDFGTRQVRLTLTTDNPAGFKIPFLSDLWQGARQELFKINVRGTVQDPKVQPSSLGTVTTTIDEVFKGDASRK